MAAKDLYEKDFYKVLGVDKKLLPMKLRRSTAHLPAIYTLIKQKVMRQKKKSSKPYLKRMKFYPMRKSAPNTMKPVLYLKEADSVHHKAEVFKVVISAMSLAAEIHKTSSQIYLVADVGVPAKDKIYKLKQRLPFVNQFSEQL